MVLLASEHWNMFLSAERKVDEWTRPKKSRRATQRHQRQPKIRVLGCSEETNFLKEYPHEHWGEHANISGQESNPDPWRPLSRCMLATATSFQMEVMYQGSQGWDLMDSCHVWQSSKGITEGIKAPEPSRPVGQATTPQPWSYWHIAWASPTSSVAGVHCTSSSGGQSHNETNKSPSALIMDNKAAWIDYQHNEWINPFPWVPGW